MSKKQTKKVSTKKAAPKKAAKEKAPKAVKTPKVKEAPLVTRSVRFHAADIKAAEAKGLNVSAFCREALTRAVK